MKNIINIVLNKKNMSAIIKNIIKKIFFKIGGWEYIESKLVLEGIRNSKLNIKKNKIKNLSEVEFSVFSQWGEDGIIDWLISKIPTIKKVFLEIGTQDYKESNTRFLLIKNNWTGYLIDSTRKDIENIKRQRVYWKYDLNAFNYTVTRENINSILGKINIPKNIGILSIDIDGNDYWILKSIKNLEADIVICEYNSILGNKHELTVNYKADFNRTNFHYSNLAFGASIQAFIKLLKKNYIFIGTSSSGVNAFFLRRNKYISISKKIKEKKIFYSKNRESRNKKGMKNFISGKKRLMKIQEKSFYQINKKKMIKLKSLKI